MSKDVGVQVPLRAPIELNIMGYIKKNELEHGAYYLGRCRNAVVARWNAANNEFIHWRYKFGAKFLEVINHKDDDDGFDTFKPERKLNPEEVLDEIMLP